MHIAADNFYDDHPTYVYTHARTQFGSKQNISNACLILCCTYMCYMPPIHRLAGDNDSGCVSMPFLYALIISSLAALVLSSVFIATVAYMCALHAICTCYVLRCIHMLNILAPLTPCWHAQSSLSCSSLLVVVVEK